MPQGSIRVGDVEITALRDVFTDAPGTLSEWFPGVPDEEWSGIKERYPETIASEERWKYYVHCYLVRAAARTILVDTGIGPAGTPISDWLHPPGGSLMDELAQAGLNVNDVDFVVITHMHIDHIGWNVTESGPTFPNATYLAQEADWEAYADEQDPNGRTQRDRLVRRLRDLDVLELVRGERQLTDGVKLAHTPGHTPGSQSVRIAAGDEWALLAGDIANHPMQVEHPDWHSMGDGDPQTAAATRKDWFRRLENDGGVVATAHFPHPFGRIQRGAWTPLP